MMDVNSEAAVIDRLARRYGHLSYGDVASAFRGAYNQKMAELEASGATGRHLPALAVNAGMTAVVMLARGVKQGPD